MGGQVQPRVNRSAFSANPPAGVGFLHVINQQKTEIKN
jgi:hypothetical protein